ncbi:MSMEG_4193 family putative phosphomutase [Kocuria sp. cx-116]|uniref:MSMEG_4193 family putative phosphomutase n=1 Tax=Kocuria sp. cx-116 TaxID=2771378 RepID=UPI00168463B2|nr:MSMEG_4193 family putative phosphomutase [Kocuria sp. cx-116]MBD2762507.1 MSMEG_4193 family putative phosphomutase [Kocuria sp. cx-116]
MSPETTTLLLVRHGQTPTTGHVLPGRTPGLHLSDTGREQATRVATRLTDLALTALYSSPLERTRETAQATADATGLPVLEEHGLLELDVGDWAGENLADLARMPEWQTVQHEPASFTFPGGEGFQDMLERMVDALARIRAAHPGGTMVCFSHADPIRAVLAHAMGTPLDKFQRLSVGPCSVSAIAYPQGLDPVVLTVNSTQDSLATLTAQ